MLWVAAQVAGLQGQGWPCRLQDPAQDPAQGYVNLHFNFKLAAVKSHAGCIARLIASLTPRRVRRVGGTCAGLKDLRALPARQPIYACVGYWTYQVAAWIQF
jgi:hypothetical protein